MKLLKFLTVCLVSSFVSVAALAAEKQEEIIEKTVKPVVGSIEGMMKKISAHEAGTFMTKDDAEAGAKEAADCDKTLETVFTKVDGKVPVAGLGSMTLMQMRQLCVRELAMMFKGALDSKNYVGGKPQKKIVKAAIPPPP